MTMPLFLLTILAACKPEPLTGLPNEPGGDPLVPGRAMHPFPSSFYLVEADTPTGWRVEIPAEALPGALRPETFAHLDGYTRFPALLASFPGGVDGSTLPPEDDLDTSLGADAPIALIRASDGARVPLLAEVDAHSPGAFDDTLIGRPQRALDWDTEYVVLVTDRVRTRDGAPPAPTEAFRALRDGIPTDSDAVEAWRPGFETINAVIAESGWAPEEIVLGWSFRTGSQQGVAGPMLSMTSQMMAADLGEFVTESTEREGDNTLIRGHFTAPDFLGDDNILQVTDGAVAARGTRQVPVLLTIPDTVTEARPAILFGHGFFSSIDEPTWGSLQSLVQPYAFPVVSTDFLGFREADQTQTLQILAGDLNRTAEIAAQQMQSQANHVAVARVFREQLQDSVAIEREAGSLDPFDDRLVYMGISNGGTQGFTIMSTAPNLDRGVLVVPGGAMSHMLQRATQWNTMGLLLANQYERAQDLQIAVALMQHGLDPFDGINFVDHLLTDPFEGRPEKRVVIHEARWDCQVSNWITGVMGRTAGVPVWEASAREIPGLEGIPANADPLTLQAAYTVWDEAYEPLPTGNTPPASDNGAHETIRRIDAYREAVAAFVERDEIVNTCDGACDPE